MVRGQIAVHVFAPNGDYCLYPSVNCLNILIFSVHISVSGHLCKDLDIGYGSHKFRFLSHTTLVCEVVLFFSLYFSMTKPNSRTGRISELDHDLSLSCLNKHCGNITKSCD